MINEKIKMIVDNIGNKSVSVKYNTGLSLCLTDALIGHGPSLTEVSELISNVLLKEVKMFKNSILPNVSKLTKEIEDSITAKQVDMNEITPDLIKLTIPDFIHEVNERKLLDGVASNSRLPAVGLLIPMVENISEFLKVDKGSLGISTKEFLDTIPEKDFKRIWNDYLGNLGFNNTSFLRLSIKEKITSETVNDPYVLFVLLNNLVDNIPSGVSATLGEYNSKIKSVLSLVKNVISNRLKMEEVYLNNNTILISSHENSILVNKTNYDAYVRKEGDVECILGASILRESNLSNDDLILNGNKYKTTWNNHYVLQLSKTRSALSRIHRVTYSNFFRNLLSEISDELIELNELTSVDNLIDDVIDLINNLNTNEIYEVKSVVTRVYTDILYKNTNLKTFLNYMDGYMKMDSSVTVDRALTFTLLDLTVDYVSTMLEVK